MEKYIGKDFVFHDAEVDSVKIDREGMVKGDYGRGQTWTMRSISMRISLCTDAGMIRPSAMCCDLKSLNGTLR